MPKLSIIIPIYNEADSIAPLSERLAKALDTLPEAEVIAVNDGSSDGTIGALRAWAGRDPRVKVLSLRRNFGQTAAISAGIDHAQGEIIVPMDADLENDPADIALLLAKLNEGYDIVSGWRQHRWEDRKFSRRFTSQAANWLISKVSGVALHDYGCTLKAYRAEVIKPVQLYGEMHRFIPALASWQGAKVTELPVAYAPRQFGQSKYGLNRVLKVLLDLITVKFLNDYSAKPIYFFGKVGVGSLTLGVVAFALATYWKVTGQKDYIQTPLPVITVMFFVMSVLLVLIGLLAEMIMRLHHESVGKKTYVVKEKINL